MFVVYSLTRSFSPADQEQQPQRTNEKQLQCNSQVYSCNTFVLQKAKFHSCVKLSHQQMRNAICTEYLFGAWSMNARWHQTVGKPFANVIHLDYDGFYKNIITQQGFDMKVPFLFPCKYYTRTHTHRKAFKHGDGQERSWEYHNSNTKRYKESASDFTVRSILRLIPLLKRMREI